MNKIMFTRKIFNLLMLHNEIDVVNPIQQNCVYGIHKDVEPEIYDRIMRVIGISTEDSLGMATNYYYNTYFKPLKCDELYNEMLALQLMDIAYNTTVPAAISLLQKALNIMYDKKVVEMDGTMGDITIHVLNNTNQEVLNNILVNTRKEYVTALLAGRPMNGQLIIKMNSHADKFLI